MMLAINKLLAPPKVIANARAAISLAVNLTSASNYKEQRTNRKYEILYQI